MDDETLRRFANQIRKTASGGSRPPAGFFAGTGLLVALVAGGFALNASLFNGARSLYFFDHRLIRREQLTVVTERLNILGK